MCVCVCVCVCVCAHVCACVCVHERGGEREGKGWEEKKRREKKLVVTQLGLRSQARPSTGCGASAVGHGTAWADCPLQVSEGRAQYLSQHRGLAIQPASWLSILTQHPSQLPGQHEHTFSAGPAQDLFQDICQMDMECFLQWNTICSHHFTLCEMCVGDGCIINILTCLFKCLKLILIGW